MITPPDLGPAAAPGLDAGLACPGLRVSNLTLRFGPLTVFEDLSFEVAGGRYVALLGPSGVGKSSILKVLAGLASPSAGRCEATDGKPLAGRVAYMGQTDLLYPWLRVIDNVMLGSRLRGERRDAGRAMHLLERVGLAGRAGALPAELSGGMRQRAAIARTLYEARPVVLMDEPFSALDTFTRARIQELSAELMAGCTVLLITHDPLEACRLARRIHIMSGFPARLSEAVVLGGDPPRQVDDPQVLQTQGALLRALLGEPA